MPSIDLTNVQEATGAFDIEPGGYVMVITGVDPQPNDQRCFLKLDVAEGPQAGFYKGSQYPISEMLSWKPKALGFLKHKLHVIADSNTGFDPVAAFQSDQWQAFVGKHVGAIVRKQLYTWEGQDRERAEVAEIVTPDEVRSGSFRVPAPRDRRDRSAAAPAPSVPAAPTAPATSFPWE